MILATISIVLMVTGADLPSQPQNVLTLKTDSFTLGVTIDGHIASLVDLRTGIDYCDHSAHMPFAVARSNGRAFPSSAVRLDDDRLTVVFGGLGGVAVFRVAPERRRLRFEVVSFTCSNVQELVFAQIPLTLKGDRKDPFGVSPLALNLKTNCSQIPGVCAVVEGFIAYPSLGFVGACGAIVAASMSELRDGLKDAVESSPELPHSDLGGPWALDAPINYGSYVIDAEGSITEANVGEWIDAAKRVGATQIDFHGGRSTRFGDYEPNRELYPKGRESLKAVVDAIHAAGLAACLHTYAFFIAKETPWVTPVPSPDLDKDASFTLSNDLGQADVSVPVDESTQAMSAVTGFQVRNSATIQIDDELITYAGLSKTAPYAFTQCVRGALGARAASHAKGAKVHHLKECFGLFTPKGDSPLSDAVAQATADTYNACGFDMIYLDALDGSDIIAGWPLAWHYQAKFVFELARRIQRPALLEMSTFSHHLWVVRSRMESWDVPSRAVKQFVDIHVLLNRRWQNAFLPTHLGWWGVFNWDGVHPERSFTDDMEYVCTKALATDASLSYFVGFTPKDQTGDNSRRMAAIAKRYEDLRKAGTVPASIKERLAAPGAEFSLETAADGAWKFRPATYTDHRVNLTEEPARFTTPNTYAAQPLQLRIEVPMVTEAADSPEAQVLAMDKPGEFGPAEAQQGVSGSLALTADGSGALLAAKNETAEPACAWLAFRKEFPTPIDFTGKGLGLWVTGDGQGEVINVQVRSPQHLAGGLADHYIHVDFTGRRYFELIEPESDELSRYQWAHTRRWVDYVKAAGTCGTATYSMYHTWVSYGQIGSLTIGVNNLPVGKAIQVGLSPIKALPLARCALANPSITIRDATLHFPVTLESGSYLEFLGTSDCKVYDAKGQCIANVTPTGDVPTLGQGDNACVLDVTRGGGPLRAKVTVITHGEPLRP